MVIYIGPTIPARTALGRTARREGLLAGLADCGHAPELLELGSRWERLPTYFQLISNARALRLRADRLELDAGPAVILEGADVAVAYAVAFVGRRRPPTKVHVDVCDSVCLLARTDALGARRSRARTALKRVLARAVVFIVARVADSVSYISQRDLEHDSLFMATVPNKAVVRMARPPQPLANRDRNGPFVVVGDWGYSPNRAMLDDTLSWMGDWGLNRTERLRVVGPNLPSPPSADGINYVGWVDVLVDGFAGTSCALALLRSGAGVKNKVMDALACGVPVAGTEEALNGIPFSPNALLLEPGMGPEFVWTWAQGLEVQAETDPGWGVAVEPILSALGLTRGVPG